VPPKATVKKEGGGRTICEEQGDIKGRENRFKESNSAKKEQTGHAKGKGRKGGTAKKELPKRHEKI